MTLWRRLPRLRCETERWLHLDLLRFVAAYAIVVYHFRKGLRFGPLADLIERRLDALNLAVDLFFVVSGVIITYVYAERIGSARDYGRFLQKRAARLVPLHWATLAFYAALALAAAKLGARGQDPSRYDWSCLPWNVVMLHSLHVCRGLSFNFVSWSVSAEALVYVAFPLSLLLFRRSVWAPLVAGIVMLAALYTFASRGPEPFWEWTYDFGVARAVPGFLVGMSLYGLRERLAKLPRSGELLFGLMALFLAGVLAGAPKEWLLPLVYLIAATGVAADAGRRAGPMVRRLAPLGQLTYSVYLLHPLFQTVMLTLVGDQLLHLKTAGHSVLVLICLPLVSVAAYVSLFAFETPARRWISRLGGGRTEPAVAAELAP